jgi:hypothetical protein
MILMIGMIVSGKIFGLFYGKTAEADNNIKPPVDLQPAEEVIPPAGAKETADSPASETELTAAVSVALHMHFSQLQPSEPMQLVPNFLTPWTQQGRERIMGERFQTFNRVHR